MAAAGFGVGNVEEEVRVSGATGFAKTSSARALFAGCALAGGFATVLA